MQLEPHFLFNTLNAITTLVELGRQGSCADARPSEHNSQSTLKRTTPGKVPLSQELEIVENYLAIEQVRFADRLRIEIKVEPALLTAWCRVSCSSPLSRMPFGTASRIARAKVWLKRRPARRSYAAPAGEGLGNWKERAAPSQEMGSG